MTKAGLTVSAVFFWLLLHVLAALWINARALGAGDPKPPTVKLDWKPEDLWLGFYWDADRETLYQCVIPCVALVWRRNG